ncbi:hypothetical protein E9229_000040 [Paeniglutamicibacter cryotolerans]|uniref:Uncharacterized protein n=1 Tax=Paeniglutamicibacter cryotolerans TaxID=670079 RepID=A0A839QCK3_9MICC|nr:hypothetical protein [Paeniglutamicibacter cryotolerans]
MPPISRCRHVDSVQRVSYPALVVKEQCGPESFLRAVSFTVALSSNSTFAMLALLNWKTRLSRVVARPDNSG